MAPGARDVSCRPSSSTTFVESGLSLWSVWEAGSGDRSFGREESVRGSRRRGFSLIELLVVLAVATILLGLLMPTFQQLRDSARQIVCANNQHQIGLGIHSYTTDNRDRLPHSVLVAYPTGPQDMMALHLGENRPNNWDGLGRLYQGQYVRSPETFYCPAHRGDHLYSRHADTWANPGADELFANYHYRGVLDSRPISDYSLDRLQVMRESIALLSDGLRLRSDFNHVTGANVLRTDLSVRWVTDAEQAIVSVLPETLSQDWPTRIWVTIDTKITETFSECLSGWVSGSSFCRPPRNSFRPFGGPFCMRSAVCRLKSAVPRKSSRPASPRCVCAARRSEAGVGVTICSVAGRYRRRIDSRICRACRVGSRGLSHRSWRRPMRMVVRIGWMPTGGSRLFPDPESQGLGRLS